MKYISILLLLFSLNATAQKAPIKYDSIARCVLLVSDTGQSNVQFTIGGSAIGNAVVSIKAYALLAKHNTAEGVIDPGGTTCVDNHGNIVSCYSDYWVEVGYLDMDKRPLPKGLCVWMAIVYKK